MSAAATTGAAPSKKRAERAIAAAAATTTPSCAGPKDSGASGFAGVWVSALIGSVLWPSERRHRRLRPSEADRLLLHEPEGVSHFEVHRRGLARLEVQLERGVRGEIRLVGLPVAVRVPPVAVAHAGRRAHDVVVVA